MISSISAAMPRFSRQPLAPHQAAIPTIELKGRLLGNVREVDDEGRSVDRTRVRLKREDMKALVKAVYDYTAASFKEAKLPTAVRVKIGDQVFRIKMNPNYLGLYETRAIKANEPMVVGQIAAQREIAMAKQAMTRLSGEVATVATQIPVAKDNELKTKLSMLASFSTIKTPADLKA